jgi:hypothetical protein
VGCGLGYGIEILAQHAKDVHGQDLDPRLGKNPKIMIRPIESIPDRSFDVVTSVDVVEHVEKDEYFVEHLVRIARDAVFLTTPNWTASRCVWPYHLREYTPRELAQLLAPHGDVTLFKGDPSGKTVYAVRWRSSYYLLNDLRVWPLTAFATRCANHLLPAPRRLCSHNAALLCLS